MQATTVRIRIPTDGIAERGRRQYSVTERHKDYTEIEIRERPRAKRRCQQAEESGQDEKTGVG